MEETRNEKLQKRLDAMTDLFEREIDQSLFAKSMNVTSRALGETPAAPDGEALPDILSRLARRLEEARARFEDVELEKSPAVRQSVGEILAAELSGSALSEAILQLEAEYNGLATVDLAWLDEAIRRLKDEQRKE